MNALQWYIRVTLCVASIGLLLSESSAQQVSVQAAVSAETAYVGQRVTFQIQVRSDREVGQPSAPDVSALEENFSVEQGRVSSSIESRSFNGVRRQIIQYNLNYSISPKRPGRFEIPSITVQAGGVTRKTRPFFLTAKKPQEMENFKLRVKLDRDVAYVGEPVVMDLEFFFTPNARNPDPTVPFLDGDDFHVYSLDVDPKASRQVRMDGKTFNVMRMRKVLVPKTAGPVQLESATLAFEGVVGYQRGIFGRSPVWNAFVIPSNEISLNVRELPTDGRPPGFSGHIGQYTVSSSASPLKVSVGDPISLSVTLSGPPYLEHIQFPSLGSQAELNRHFQVSIDDGEGVVNGRNKLFKLTVRATSDQVHEIPPVELPYFDSAGGSYEVARSRPIPIEVTPTTVVTIDDAEGIAPVLGGGSSEVEGSLRGIAHNYENLDALVDQHFEFFAWLQRPLVLGLLGLPPLIYFALFGASRVRRRREADPDRQRSRRALGDFQKALHNAEDPSAVLEAFRCYLGAKLALASGALTFKDVAVPLRERGVAEESVSEINGLFEQCEASRYAGSSAVKDTQELANHSLELARTLEKQLK